MRQIARGLSHLKAPIDTVLTSPYLRAMQTAGILAKELDLGKEKVSVTETLAPAGDPDRLVHEINERFGGLEGLALVGHEPSLSRLISVLVSGEASLSIELRKGGVCRLSVEKLQYGRCATMEWLLAPAHLRRISG